MVVGGNGISGRMLTVTYRRRAVYAAFALAVLCLVSTLAYGQVSVRGTWAAMYCVRHESTHNHTANEDVDCILEGRDPNKDRVSFELTGVSLRRLFAEKGASAVSAASPEHGGGPLMLPAQDGDFGTPGASIKAMPSHGAAASARRRPIRFQVVLKSKPNETRVLKTLSSQIAAQDLHDKIARFLKRAHHESAGPVTLLLRVDDPGPPRFLTLGALAVALLLLFVPAVELSVFDADREMFTQTVRNCVGVALRRVVMPLERVSRMTVLQGVVTHVEPSSRRMRVSLRKHREYHLQLQVQHSASAGPETTFLLSRKVSLRGELDALAARVNRFLLEHASHRGGLLEEARLSGPEKSEAVRARGSGAGNSSNSAGSGNGAANPCVVCLSRRANVALLPCKHQCTCARCGNLVQQCPICRSAVQERLVLYVV